jgi:hypothetical protein
LSNYTKSTNFATKDNLTPGDPLKIVRGTEIDTEFNNIATAIATKTDNASAAITGGTINDTTIGATTASTGAFTTLGATGVATFSAGSAGAPAITTTGDTNTGMFFPAADTIAFAEGGAEIARFDTSGNLGLGVTPSAWGGGYKAIDVQFGAIANTNAGSVDVAVTQNAFFNGSNWITKYTGASRRYVMSDGGHSWFNGASQTAGNAITLTQAMTLDASGNWILGGTSANGRARIVGAASTDSILNLETSTNNYASGIQLNALNANGASYNYISSKYGSTENWYIGGNGVDQTLVLKTGGSERARIDSSGNLLVGTTTAGGRLAVTAGSAAQSPIATTSVTGDTAYQAILVTKFDNDSTTSQNFIQFQINNGSANCGKITANGANTAAFGSTSDQRVKENIAELPSQLANIMALRPVEFDYIESYGGGHQVGFIAQEIQQVYPDVISTDDSSEKIMSITGWSKTEARLVKAIQEQQAIIESLKARLDAANL